MHQPDPVTTRSHVGPWTTVMGRLALAVVVLGLLVALRVVSPPAWSDALPAAARDVVTLSVSVLVESLPFVFLGIIISILVQVWLPDRVWDLLPRSPALRRLVLSGLGVVLPVCECGNVPLARGLMLRGLGVGESLTFLMAAPILNPVTILTTYIDPEDGEPVKLWAPLGSQAIVPFDGTLGVGEFEGRKTEQVGSRDTEKTFRKAMLGRDTDWIATSLSQVAQDNPKLAHTSGPSGCDGE